MQKIISRLSSPALPALVVGAGMIGALSLQHLLGWVPCALCIVQRLTSIGLLVGLSLFAMSAKGSWLRIVAWGLSALAAIGGVVAAGAHLSLIWSSEPVTCGPGVALYVAQLVDLIPGSAWLLEGSGPCEEARYQLLGLPLPVWSGLLHLGGFFGAVAVSLKTAVKP
jgi:disulfide bond formation protein DsbB